MRKFIVSKTEPWIEYELSPLSYREFSTLNTWTGSDDMAYDEWLRKNNFHEVSQFNDDFLAKCRLELRDLAPSIVFKISDQEDSWAPFDQDAATVAQDHCFVAERGCLKLKDENA